MNVPKLAAVVIFSMLVTISYTAFSQGISAKRHQATSKKTRTKSEGIKPNTNTNTPTIPQEESLKLKSKKTKKVVIVPAPPPPPGNDPIPPKRNP